MSAFDQAEMANAREAKQLIEAVPRIAEVETFTVEPFIDWSGDASLRIDIVLFHTTVVDEPFLDRYQDYTWKVAKAILHSDLNRFPYIHLKKAA